jgi:hypothetical protein
MGSTTRRCLQAAVVRGGRGQRGMRWLATQIMQLGARALPGRVLPPALVRFQPARVQQIHSPCIPPCLSPSSLLIGIPCTQRHQTLRAGLTSRPVAAVAMARSGPLSKTETRAFASDRRSFPPRKSPDLVLERRLLAGRRTQRAIHSFASLSLSLARTPKHRALLLHSFIRTLSSSSTGRDTDTLRSSRGHQGLFRSFSSSSRPRPRAPCSSSRSPTRSAKPYVPLALRRAAAPRRSRARAAVRARDAHVPAPLLLHLRAPAVPHPGRASRVRARDGRPGRRDHGPPPRAPARRGRGQPLPRPRHAGRRAPRLRPPAAPDGRRLRRRLTRPGGADGARARWFPRTASDLPRSPPRCMRPVSRQRSPSRRRSRPSVSTR